MSDGPQASERGNRSAAKEAGRAILLSWEITDFPTHREPQAVCRNVAALNIPARCRHLAELFLTAFGRLRWRTGSISQAEGGCGWQGRQPPGNPRRGFPTENAPLGRFPTLLRLLTLFKVKGQTSGLCPEPRKGPCAP